MDWIYQQTGITDRQDHRLQRQILNIASQAKIALTDRSHTKIEINGWRGTLSREQLNTLIRPLIKRTLLTCRLAIKDAAIDR